MITSLTRTPSGDPRLEPATWDPTEAWAAARRKLRLLLPVQVVLTIWYFSWLLEPARVGNRLLYGLLVAAEAFNVVQAAGFWWTCAAARRRAEVVSWPGTQPEVDVLIPVYNEPVAVVGPTVAAAGRLRGRSTSSTTPAAPSWRPWPPATGRSICAAPTTPGPRPGTSTTPWPRPPPPSSWCWTATTWPTPGCWRRPSGT